MAVGSVLLSLFACRGATSSVVDTASSPTSTDSGSSTPDTGSSPDTSPPDTGLKDTGSTDSGSPDTGTPSLCPDHTLGEVELVIYLSPDGDDTASGTSPEEALATLSAADEVLRDRLPEGDVEVRIAPGTYTGQSLTWYHHSPAHTTRLVALDYDLKTGQIDEGLRPVFDGQGAARFLSISAESGEPSNIEVLGLHVTGYVELGVYFAGNRDDPVAGWNGGNRVQGNVFSQIGNKGWKTKTIGIAAVDLYHSRDNLVCDNEFVEIENTLKPSSVHAVYLAHYSSGNHITHNRFSQVSGDALRFRDQSNGNLLEDNTFSYTSSNGHYADWYCVKELGSDCTREEPECPSWSNTVRNNMLGCGYDGKSLPESWFHGEDTLYNDCTDHGAEDGWVRVTLEQNAITCPE